MSVIVRTSGLTATLSELQWDLNSYLLKLWSSIEEAAANERGPVLIYRENNLLLRRCATTSVPILKTSLAITPTVIESCVSMYLWFFPRFG